jgi:uroporphyrinogen-III synthase
MKTRLLAGKRIVVTRPREQAAGLAALIRDAGGEALLFPAIEIRALADPRKVGALLERLDEFELAIFVSRNAVVKALELARERRPGRAWPARLAVATVGGGSRRELERQGFSGVIAPGGEADSEALLALPELRAVDGKAVLIFRGEGGREFLGETLATRGARVEYAECYRRVRPDVDPAPLAAALERGEVDAVTVSSAEGLANLLKYFDAVGRQRLQRVALFVPHRRVAEAAAGLGMRAALVGGPDDAEVLAALVAYFGRTR